MTNEEEREVDRNVHVGGDGERADWRVSSEQQWGWLSNNIIGVYAAIEPAPQLHFASVHQVYTSHMHVHVYFIRICRWTDR